MSIRKLFDITKHDTLVGDDCLKDLWRESNLTAKFNKKGM